MHILNCHFVPSLAFNISTKLNLGLSHKNFPFLFSKASLTALSCNHNYTDQVSVLTPSYLKSIYVYLCLISVCFFFFCFTCGSLPCVGCFCFHKWVTFDTYFFTVTRYTQRVKEWCLSFNNLELDSFNVYNTSYLFLFMWYNRSRQWEKTAP